MRPPNQLVTASLGVVACALISLVARCVAAGEKDVAPAADASGHWAFRTIRQTLPPAVREAAWPQQGIDSFILAGLEAVGIQPSAAADRRTLLRRLSLDLVGLPPSPEEVAEFVRDDRPDAYERAVDRLLASPHHGEKWARSWLDLCHHADTDGYLTDQLRPVAWRYRQWVVDALNREDSGVEQRIATGFLRSTLSNREGGADLEEFRVEQVVDRVEMVGATWLGLTLGCARCHDHKHDPIRQQEFYQLYAFFDAADEVNIDAPLPGELEARLARQPEYDRKRQELFQPVARDLAELQTRWETRLLHAALHPGADPVWDREWEVLGLIWGGNLGEGQLEGCEIVRLEPARRTTDEKERLLDYFLQRGEIIDPPKFKELKLGELASAVAALKKTLPGITRAAAMRATRNSRSTYLHARGDFRRRGPDVAPGTPAWLHSLPDGVKPDRLALARWLIAPDNPLTARVTVNRAWQELFGRGLVPTSADFGTHGDRPSPAELLDFLATEFILPCVENGMGWSLKQLHRRLVTSATYRQSSHARRELMARDPHNALLARQVPLRLSADLIRDTALAASGLLDRRIGGPSVYPPQPESVAMEGFENKWIPSTGSDRYQGRNFRLTDVAGEVVLKLMA